MGGRRSIGLKPWLVMRLIILPQAVRRILPALGNQFVYVLKMSSLISVVGYQELTRRANELTLIEYRPLEIYTLLLVSGADRRRLLARAPPREAHGRLGPGH